MFPFPLYLITDPLLYASLEARGKKDRSRPLLDAVGQAIEGGARLIQYRDKTATRREMYETAKKLRDLTAGRGATLIINDEIDLALAVRADGVHLGQDDLPIRIARGLLGEKAIVGVSTHNLNQAIQAESDRADYIGFGPIFKTSTKELENPPLGISAVGHVTREVQIPVYAIGGIQFSDLSELMMAGAAGVAVISALAGEIQTNVSRWLTFFKTTGKLDKRGQSR
jgi:thiamine-phosphate pyrophosphorylase